MSAYQEARARLRESPRRWVVTGAAGFIGSHLVEHLLSLDQTVVGLDNFATGFPRNLDDVRETVGEAAWGRFSFVEGDVRDLETCRTVCRGCDVVLHQAALGSVPRSLDDPIATHASNLSGFLNMLVAARDAKVGRFVYAASSAVYGDSTELPKVEERIGQPLSPYAVTKLGNELYGKVFADAYGMEVVGLRYFNVFGPRQDPDGAYAAVIPRWIGQLLRREPCRINGDGETSRDFTFVENVVQANLLAATVAGIPAGSVYNVACGERTTLTQLYQAVRGALAEMDPAVATLEPVHGPTRPQDVRHSQADISRARSELGYAPTRTVAEGLLDTVRWFGSKHDGTHPVDAGVGAH